MANQYRSITAKGIESIFRVLIDADPRIARFRVGDYALAETMEDVYPMVILDFLGSRIERKATLHYKRWDIRLECYGMRRADGKNTTDVFAETDTILDDLVLRFVGEQDLIDMGFHFDARVSNNEYVIRNDRDDLIGVRTTISFNTPLMQCPDDFPVDALPDLGLYYSASTLTASSQYLTCLTLSGCSTIQSIQDDIAELYTLTGGTSTYVQDGVNTYTGGTPSAPTVNVVASPVFTSVSATTYFSGATNLSHLLTGGVSAGLNLYKSGNEIGVVGEVIVTGLTATRDTVLSAIVGENTGNGYGVQGIGTTQPGVFAYSYSGMAFYANTDSMEEDLGRFYNQTLSGLRILNDGGLLWNSTTGMQTTRTNLGVPFVQPGTNITTGGTITSPVISTVGSPTFTAVTANDFISGATNLNSIFASISVVPTYVQPGTNITTGGTITRPTVNVVTSPSFTTVSAVTFVENGTSLALKYALASTPELMTPVVGSTQTTTLATLSDVTGSTMSLDSSSWYEVEWNFIYTAAATTTGAFFAVNGSTTADYVSGVVYYDTGTGDGDSRVFNAFNQGFATPSSRTTGNNRGLIRMMIKTSSAINVLFRYATEVAGSAIGVTDISGFKLKKL